MLSNIFHVYKYALLSILIGGIMVALGMMLKIGEVGIYILPLLVGVGSIVVLLGILKQFHVLKDDGYFDSVSLKGVLKRKNKVKKPAVNNVKPKVVVKKK